METKTFPSSRALTRSCRTLPGWKRSFRSVKCSIRLSLTSVSPPLPPLEEDPGSLPLQYRLFAVQPVGNQRSIQTKISIPHNTAHVAKTFTTKFRSCSHTLICSNITLRSQVVCKLAAILDRRLRKGQSGSGGGLISTHYAQQRSCPRVWRFSGLSDERVCSSHLL